MPINSFPSPPSRAATTTDFYRPVHSILGLPVDAVTLHSVKTHVYSSAAARRNCFLSTPNLNFAVGCMNDGEFRNSVINSDLSIADGMPLVWVARLFGIPIRKRVTGSGLFEELRQQPERILSVYLFGGQDGTARLAAERINSGASGLNCVGSLSPGFGSLEEISGETVINDINNSHADFLVVALGAKKGQAWIERNRPRLRVPIVSHLGAVVNFASGGVRRAPQWVQRLGFEWLWRIREEPALWRRYLHDGSTLFRLLLTRVLPSALHQRLRRPRRTALVNAWVSFSGENSRQCIAPHGSWCENNLIRIRRSFEKVARQQVDVEINLSQTGYIDSAFVGLLMLLYGHQTRLGLDFVVRGVSPALRRTFRGYCAEFLLQPEGAGNAMGRGNRNPWQQRIAAGS
jgi:N-acetylglucosaminyldiphosphoundecaprenol N-acetyl-beta-D-mannosaminyltransferase